MFLACNIYVLERREVYAPWDRGAQGAIARKNIEITNCSGKLFQSIAESLLSGAIVSISQADQWIDRCPTIF